MLRVFFFFEAEYGRGQRLGVFSVDIKVEGGYIVAELQILGPCLPRISGL